MTERLLAPRVHCFEAKPSPCDERRTGGGNIRDKMQSEAEKRSGGIGHGVAPRPPPPSAHDGFPIPLAISRGVGVQCPHPPGKEHSSYMLCLSSPSAHSQTWGPPPPAANVINMLRHPSSIRQCPAGLCLHQPTIDSFIWAPLLLW